MFHFAVFWIVQEDAFAKVQKSVEENGQGAKMTRRLKVLLPKIPSGKLIHNKVILPCIVTHFLWKMKTLEKIKKGLSGQTSQELQMLSCPPLTVSH